MDFHDILRTDILRTIGAKAPLTVDKESDLVEIFDLLKRKGKGCVMVMDNHKLVGICTERDLMKKIVEPKKPLSTKIKEIMTPNPQTLNITDSVESIIKLMHEGGYRHVPIVEGDQLIGYISVKDVVDYLAEHFPHGVYNLPPNFRQVISSPEGG